MCTYSYWTSYNTSTSSTSAQEAVLQYAATELNSLVFMMKRDTATTVNCHTVLYSEAVVALLGESEDRRTLASDLKATEDVGFEKLLTNVTGRPQQGSVSDLDK